MKRKLKGGQEESSRFRQVLANLFGIRRMVGKRASLLLVEKLFKK
jgi:hypothetical protein